FSINHRPHSFTLFPYTTLFRSKPQLTLAHFGLALIEGKQNHFAAAMPHLRRVIEIDPKAAGAYYALSDCALRTGRKQESVEYARSEEHTSELQSRGHLVCRLLL